MLPIRECTVLYGNFHNMLTTHNLLTIISSEYTIEVDQLSNFFFRGMKTFQLIINCYSSFVSIPPSTPQRCGSSSARRRNVPSPCVRGERWGPPPVFGRLIPSSFSLPRTIFCKM